MAPPTVFISYSHRDETWKDQLLTHLGVLQQQSILELWHDGALLHPRDVQRLVQGHAWPAYELPERGILIPQLSALASQMQTRRTVNEAGQVRIPYDEALALLAHPRSEDILRGGEALGVLEEDRGRDEVLYVHQLLQEYFAARHLARAPQAGLVQQEWRAERVVPSLQDTLHDLADADPLPPSPSTGWEETTMLAAAMASDPDSFISELIPQSLALAGRCAAQPEVRLTEALKDRLSAQTGQTFRLPTEAEWEAAARSVQRRRYAFGDDFDAARCNAFEAHIRHTTPIDVFPGGRTPEGLVDMTGNTWDWTSSLYMPYPYDAADGREVASLPGARRVVRGGSWSVGQVHARVLSRRRRARLSRRQCGPAGGAVVP
jgi:hypothetical protein